MNAFHSVFGNRIKGKPIGLWVGCVATLLVLTVLAGAVHAGEVITEIRFRENGFIARPGEHSFIIIDIRGEEHSIPVLKGEKFVVSSSLDYRGPRQYSTEYPQGFIYRKMKISGEYYQCFYVPQSVSRSLIEREINKVIQGSD